MNRLIKDAQSDDSDNEDEPRDIRFLSDAKNSDDEEELDNDHQIKPNNQHKHEKEDDAEGEDLFYVIHGFLFLIF